MSVAASAVERIDHIVHDAERAAECAHHHDWAGLDFHKEWAQKLSPAQRTIWNDTYRAACLEYNAAAPREVFR
jgi:hypothetical protein